MNKPTTRPLIAFSILQLEEAFETAASTRDTKKIREIARELERRSVPKAKKLLRRIADEHPVNSRARPSGKEPSAGVVPKKAGRPSGQAMARAAVTPGKRARSKSPGASGRLATPLAALRQLSSSLTSRPPSRQDPVAGIDLPSRLDQAQAQQVLDAWIVAELLSPHQTYGVPSDLIAGQEADIADLVTLPDLPWHLPGRHKGRDGPCYQVVLGAVRLQEAASRLFEVFGGGGMGVSAGFAPIATLMLDREGRPVPTGAIAVSHFAWALPLALAGKFDTLAGWPDAGPLIADEIARQALPADGAGIMAVVGKPQILSLFQTLAERLGLAAELVIAPHFAIRLRQAWQGEVLPECVAVVSPHLGSLLTARRLTANGQADENLARYLGLKVPASRIDLRASDVALAEVVAPARIPLGRWPASDGRPLALAGQASANLALAEDEEASLLPINGPDGEYRTSLRRDVVAALLIERAQVMSDIGNPSEVFSHIGKVRSAEGFIDRYTISDTLKGLQILFASEDRAAPVRLTAELTALDGIDAGREGLRYFAMLADRLHGKDEVGPGSWGLLAVALGDAPEFIRLRKAIWDDENLGLRAYLLQAADRMDVGGQAGSRTMSRRPAAAEVAKPARKAENLARWQDAQRAFRAKAKDIRDRLDVLEEGRLALGGHQDAVMEGTLQAELVAADAMAAQAQALQRELEAEIAAERSALDDVERSLREHEATRPSFLRRLIGSHRKRAWSEMSARLLGTKTELAARLAGVEAKLSATVAHGAGAHALRAKLQGVLAMFDARKQSAAKEIDAAIALSGLHFVDEAFFDRPGAEVWRDTAWVNPELNHLREDLFAAALELHAAFVDAAAEPIASNLDLFFRCYSGNADWSEKMRPLMPDLWATFCCVIPVIATTFEAIEHFFPGWDVGSLGWLVIEDAGRVSPSHVVGALHRAKRAIVMGDPTQRPDDSYVSPGLAAAIAKRFDIDAQRFMAPAASAQTLAAASSAYGDTITLEKAASVSGSS